MANAIALIQRCRCRMTWPNFGGLSKRPSGATDDGACRVAPPGGAAYTRVITSPMSAPSGPSATRAESASLYFEALRFADRSYYGSSAMKKSLASANAA